MIDALVETGIGRLPAIWKVQPLSELFETQLGKMLSQKARVGNAPKPYLRNKNVQWGRIDVSDILHMDFDQREIEKFRLRPGDLLVCEGGEPGRAAIWNGALTECFYQKALHRLRPRDGRMLNDFMNYWLRFSFDLQNLYGVAGASSTIAHLPEVQLKSLPIPVPPLPEQGKIAGVLGVVQRAIEQQERLVQLTAELKHTLLHQLFTRGLRGEPQKQTEIGPVPQSWEVGKIGDVAKTQSGGTPARDNAKFWKNGTIPWVKTGEIDYRVIQDTEEHITADGLANSAAKLFPKGTLLMAMYGQGVTRGRVGILGIDATTNQACAAIILRSESEVSSHFLYYWLEYHYEDLRQLGHGANQRNMNAALIRGFPLACPDRDEQDEIVTVLSSLDCKLALDRRKHATLTALFRTLLHQLMTAQIRVHDLPMAEDVDG